MSYLNNKKRNGGYIALISAIVMTVILILISVTTSHSSFLGRFDSQTLEFKDGSYNMAKGCLDYAKLKLAQGPYLGNESITINTNSCIIDPISVGSENIVITSRSTVNNITTKLRLTVNPLTLGVISLEELSGL